MIKIGNPEIMRILKRGAVISPLPLALDENKQLDEQSQRALIRYYLSSGAGGIAVGVHTTQFEIRDPRYRLYERVLDFALRTIIEYAGERPHIKVAGICGGTEQACTEAEYAKKLGYDFGLLSLGAMRGRPDDSILAHCLEVSRIIPLFGFYLQPAVGGILLGSTFWERFFEIENVAAVKIAPFNRYQTLDVIRALGKSGREDTIILYTGNDDAIVTDLITPYPVYVEGVEKTIHIRGGLLGQWSVWTSKAVELLDRIRDIVDAGIPVPREILRIGAAITDANAVIFDAKHNFNGCIAGIHEVLRRQGLMRYTHCLSERQTLSPGQSDALNRLAIDYPFLADDEYIRSHLEQWLA